ncbi:MAG TPA: hypothetical protein VN777_07325 [Terriglobales bacterium]|nr:hypothetical protein [Terriglobales bacterium]
MLAGGIPALPAELFGVFKGAELDARLAGLQKDEIIHQGSNFTISLNALSAPGALETNDDDADQVLFVRRGSGAILLAGRLHRVGAGDVINLPRKTRYQLRTPSGRIEYVAVRISGEGRPLSRGVWSNDIFLRTVLPASEIAAEFAGGMTHLIQTAPAFFMAYSIYDNEWGPWESHVHQGHIYVVGTGHAIAELGGQIQDPKVEGDKILGSGVTGAQSYELGPGDIVVIPQDTAHHMALRKERLGYLLIQLRYP